MTKTVVCALYHFARVEVPESFRRPLLAIMEQNQIRGTLLLAAEGINGTVAGPRASIDLLQKWLRSHSPFEHVTWKESVSETMPFHRAKVKLKKEIVTMGVADIDPEKIKGTYVKPADWNALISDPDVTLIDTRNAYEVEVGTFEGAVNPNTDSFREFPEYVKSHLDPQEHKKVAMFCTGGIRCEKSTAYLKGLGFDEVYHLEGGILKYLEEVPEAQSMWQGDCFVFDNRVTVNHQLMPGEFDQCHACRRPISEEDQRSNAYVPGVSCPKCIDQTSDHQKERFLERQHQIKLARERGENHIGADAVDDQNRHRADKAQRKSVQRNQ